MGVVTPTEFEWREWRLGEGRYRGRGPASTPRPAHFPKLIPPAWWARLTEFLAKRKKAAPVNTIPAPFSGRGIVLLEPTGGTETVGLAKTAGFTYALLNLGYIHDGNWNTVRARLANLGMPAVPWKRIYTANDVRIVEETANAWRSPAAVHNLEAEAATTFPPANLASLASSYGVRPRGVMTEPWMQLIDWRPLAGWTAMPEAFLNTSPRYLPRDLVAHAHDMGIPRAVPVFGWGVWADAPHEVSPADYLAKWPIGPFAVYFGDGREARYEEWRR